MNLDHPDGLQAYNFPASCPDAYKLSRRDVFSRLTDHRFYTGIHRERFDEFGNGRGRAGREYMYIADGWTHCSSRPKEVYSTALKKPRKPVVEPGTLGVQKFGVQVTTPRLIWVYRNGDAFHEGTPIFIKNYIRNMDQLCRMITNEIHPYGGPARKLYDQHFQPIRFLCEVVDGAKYLCTSGEPPAPFNRLENFMSCWISA